MLGTAIQFITPAIIDVKEGCVYFQGATAGMISTLNPQTFSIEVSSFEVKNHGVVQEIGAGEAEAVVAEGLDEFHIKIFIYIGVLVRL